MLVGFLWASYTLLEELFGAEEAAASTLVLTFSPVTLYLAYKILSEIPGRHLDLVRSGAEREAVAQTGAVLRVPDRDARIGTPMGCCVSASPQIARLCGLTFRFSCTKV